ncbi:MAG: response regulator [Proteobacteria bacterium]|nr:response regulator [Pseudomonadota bacterium]
MPLRVLIVDDEVDTTERIQSRLVRRGYEVDLAENGQEGIERFGKNEYDVIILDIKMPVMDGIEFLTKIRSASEIPVIILTAYADKENAVKAAHLHVFDYIEKPINDLAGFLDIVDRAARLKDPVVAELDTWISKLSFEERRKPMIFEGQNSYSPKQLLEEIQKNTEFGKRHKRNIEKFVTRRNLENIR